MVRGMSVCLVLLMALSVTIPAYAREAKGGTQKLEKGVVNIVTAPVEIPKQIYKTTKESNPIVGITAGTLKGVGNLITKTLSGIFNIITCPFPGPAMEAELFPEEKPEEKVKAVK